MVKEWNLSSLSFRTARPCSWACKLSTQANTLEKNNCPHEYFDRYPPMIKAIKLRATRSLLDSIGSFSGWSESMLKATPKTFALSDHLSTCCCVFCSRWRFAGWISNCCLHYFECPLHLTACSLQPGISPMAFTAFSVGAHIAAAVRGDRASGQLKLSLQQLPRRGKIIPADQRIQRMSSS